MSETYSDNPFQPGVNQEVYLPDQLIAGNYPLVTGQEITLTGALALLRGTVLGQITDGAVATVAGVPATGSVTFTAQPAVNDTLTLGGTAITFIAEGAEPTGNQVTLGATLDETVENLIAFVEASSDSNLVKFLYEGNGAVVDLTAVTGGTGGNSLTLAKSSSAITLSGSTLSGGASNTGNGTFGTITRGAGFKLGNYKLTMTAATTFTLIDPSGVALPGGSTGTAYSNPQLGFTLTAGGTAFVAGDSFLIAAAAGSGKFQLCNANATDGSQKPSAILGDNTDASEGDVNCAAYMTGMFNGNSLTFDPSWNVMALTAALRPLGIHVRQVVTAADPVNDPD